MKKQIFSMLAIAAITISASAQSGNNNTALAVVNKNVIKEVMSEKSSISVSSELTKSFEKNYPLAQDAHWVKMDNGYRVAFVNENNNTVAVFQDNGKFQYSITDISFEQLPVVLKKIIQTDYKGTKIYKSVAINNKGSLSHQVILEGSSNYTILKAVGEDVEVSSMQNATAVK